MTNGRIGVLDAGIGGLSVRREIARVEVPALGVRWEGDEIVSA